MRNYVVVALVALYLSAVGGVLIAQVATPDAPKMKIEAADPVPDANAQTFIMSLMKNVGNQDPRIRFAFREAIVAMGAQAKIALKEAQAAQENVHVKAFIGRTLKRIKKFNKTSKKGRGRVFSMFSRNSGRDIDKIAMELNLTFEQMDKLAPVFKSYDKTSKDLMAEMKESGGFSEPGAWKDMQEELKLVAEDVRPELDKFLNEKQAKRAMRYLRRASPFGGVPMMLGDGNNISFFKSGDGTTGSVQVVIGKGGDK